MCYECGHKAPAKEIKTENGSQCPKCNSEDVFPYRRYHCGTCGHEGEQQEFFGPDNIDEDPAGRGLLGICPNQDLGDRLDPSPHGPISQIE